MTEPAVGACTCASGSQVWKGNIGTLMAKARAKAANPRICSVGSVIVPRSASRSNAPVHEPVAAWWLKAVARIATSMSSDPTSV